MVWDPVKFSLFIVRCWFSDWFHLSNNLFKPFSENVLHSKHTVYYWDNSHVLCSFCCVLQPLIRPGETDLLVFLPIWLLSPLHLHHFLLASVINSQLVSWLVLVSTSDFASACPDMTASYLVHSAATAPFFMYVSILIQKGCCWEMPCQQTLTYDLQIAGRGRRNPSVTLRGPFPDRESRALKEHVWFWYPLCCWTGNRGEWHWESSADLLGNWTRKGITCLPQQKIFRKIYRKNSFVLFWGLFFFQEIRTF